MTIAERAKQFAPFDAMKGLQEALRDREERHSRVQRHDISEEQMERNSEIFAKLTKLNAELNPHCRVSERGKVNSKKARQEAEAYLGRPLQPGEVVHHMNGHADDNRHENLLIMASSMVKPSARHRPLMQRPFSKPSSKPLIS